MNCQTTQHYLLLDATGELSRRQADRLEQHLRKCARCQAFAGDLAAINRAFPSGSADAPDAVVASVLAAAAQIPIPATSSFRRLPRRLSALAASLVIGLGLWVAFRGTQTGPRLPLPSPNARLSEISAILFAITDPELWIEQTGDSRTSAENIDAVARQLLITQGMYVEFPDDTLEEPSSLEEHQPTTLRWHNNPAPLAETCG